MSRRAWVYIWGVLLTGAMVSAMAIVADPAMSTSESLTFVVLTGLTVLTQFLEAEAPGRQSYYPHLVFMYAGVLLLHPPLFVLLVVMPHLVEWIRKRLAGSPLLRAWYLQPFNIATHLVAGFAARELFIALVPRAAPFSTPIVVLAVALSALVYVLLNHLLIGLALLLARGISLRQSGVLELANLISDLIQLILGYVVAILWQLHPLLMLPALAPLVMIYRALTVPQLQQEAHTDAKTGLWNAGHFKQLFTTELERARRFNRPLAVIMADLDLLRNINNTHGHLAGDAVLVGIGRIIRETVREYDIAARFGGEEFCIVLLEAGLVEAQAFAERLRQSIEAAAFEVATRATPIHATMSLGIACFPSDGTTLTDLIHQADVAVYQAKLRGRNGVVCASDVPHSARLEGVPAEDRLETAYPIASPRAEPAQVADERVAGAPTPETADATQPVTTTSESRGSHALLPWFVGGIIVSGVAVSISSLAIRPQVNAVVLALLVVIAILAEVLQVNVYGDNTVSVSVTGVVAAALIAGVPGVAAVSAGIALTHYLQKRPHLYKTAFNWAIHVLAGSVPALVINAQLISLQESNLPLLAVLAVVAGSVYYVVETGLIAAAISLSQGTHLTAVWHRQFRWLAGHYLVLCFMGVVLAVAYRELGALGIPAFVLPAFMMRYAQKQYVDRTQEGVRELKRMNDELTTANREIAHASRAIRQLNDELFLTLAKVIDTRDPYAAGHAAQVAHYAEAIGAELGLSSERREHLRQAALLHDIGKLGISEQVLHKPERLTQEEYNYVKSHVTLGAEFLETCRGLRHLAPFVGHHHERWDGSGYPNGLRGEQIPLEARILAVCDAVEAMASDRPYHRALSRDEIVTELRRCAGTQFDPAVVEALVQAADRQGDRFLVNSAEKVAHQQSARVDGRGRHAVWLIPQSDSSSAMSALV